MITDCAIKVFVPVWNCLYLLMGYASYRVHSAGNGFSGTAKVPLIFYCMQLLCCWTWPQTFFHFHLLGASVAHIIGLLMFIIATGAAFNRVDGIAACLFIPYTVWISYATVITYEIWRLN